MLSRPRLSLKAQQLALNCINLHSFGVLAIARHCRCWRGLGLPMHLH
nr:MAG TPA_asm: hypothetical protein [Caudoviricetes sp.]